MTNWIQLFNMNVMTYTCPNIDNGLGDLKGNPGQELGKGYRQVSNIRRTLVGNKIVDHSDIVGASPVGAAPTISSFST